MGLFVNDRAIKNYVSTYNTNAICIFTTLKPAEFKSGALFLKHPVVLVPVKIERDEPVCLRNYGLDTSKSFSGCVDVGLGRMKLRPQVLFTFSHPV